MEGSTRQNGVIMGDEMRPMISVTSNPQVFGPPPPSVPPSALSSPMNNSSPLSEDDRKNFNHRQPTTRKNPLRRVQRVSRHAALTTKQVVWDSNELSIEAALSAVDHYEARYNALRGFLVKAVNSAHSLYRTAKVSAHSLEHGFLAPVRDWILLPAFSGAEKAVAETQKFLASDTAKEMAEQSLTLARNVPLVGPVLAPTICWSGVALQRTWEILQYPIPSKQQVRDTVDWSLNTTKWALAETARAIVLYAKRADANITRTLSHTQWKVLGSGPYATLDAFNKQFVIDHLCERYFAIELIVPRYELAAHIKRHNPQLYYDLRGMLLERGGDAFADDEWLKMEPIYHHTAVQDEKPFLLPRCKNEECNEMDICALWFRLPQVNGKPPPKDAPWICFRKSEHNALERRYCQILNAPNELHLAPTITNTHEKPTKRNVEIPTLEFETAQKPCMDRASSSMSTTPPPTIAQWYDPAPDSDVFVDQMRHAVSYFFCCPKCRQRYPPVTPPMKLKGYGDECDICASSSRHSLTTSEMLTGSNPFRPPPIGMVMRPTLWRFYGTGDEVRRSSWFLDTARHGLQPFDDEAQAVLEDAYFFLKWLTARKALESDRISTVQQAFETDEETPSLDDALLTVEVSCPDGTERLIQFNSLKQATAIQKGLGAAVAVFKRRVYRGAWLLAENTSEKENISREQRSLAVKDAIQKASENHGCLGETTVPDASIRSIVASPSPLDPYENRLTVHLPAQTDISLAVPPDRLAKPDMLRRLNDDKSSKIDHLCLVVHGIGEMLRSIDLFGLSIQDLTSCCQSMRNNHVEVQDATFTQMYPTADASSRASTGRVEYLPVEWHESFAILTQRRDPLMRKGEKPNVMMQDISLRTIPNMREFANDTLMDVLFFMSPQHHDIIIDVVTHEMNLVVEKFRKITGFCGSISVVGHSLGSIISWDILNNHNLSSWDEVEVPFRNVPSIDGSLGTPSSVSPSEKSDAPEITCSLGSSPNRSTYPQLNFKVDNFFLLGSPVAVFLMIRNQRAPLSDDFRLRGCGRVFNVFHPYDPVAYRIEPCIDPRNADFEPTIIKHWNGGFRVQYRTRRIWRKIIETTSKTQHTVVEAFEQSMAGMGLLDATVDAGVDDDSESEASQITEQQFVVTGILNQGRRIDYMLQEREIENANEYVAALAAHSSYWTEKDLSLFIARQIYLSTLEHAAAEADAAAGADWESISPDDIRIQL